MTFNPTKRTDFVDDNLFSSPNSGMGEGIDSFINFLTGRSQQAALQSEQQRFDEYMYNQYNSPEALKEQFRNAGLNTNLLGSTSFGTAQSAAGAPAVNAVPMNAATDALGNIAQAASNAMDVPLKQSQSGYYASMPDLNKALTRKYGADAALSEQEWQFVNDTWQWKLMNEEFTAKGAQQAFYNAIQEMHKKKQEFENLVKEGKILDVEEETAKWERDTKEYIYNFLVDHGYYPDAGYLDRVFNDYIKTGDYSGFSRFLRAFREMEDQANKSKVSTGAVGGKLKIGPVELDTTTLQYGLDKGQDMLDLIKEKIDTFEGEKRDEVIDEIIEKLGIPNFRHKATPDQVKSFHHIDDVLRSIHSKHDGMSEEDEIKALIDNGFGIELIAQYYSWNKNGRKGE